MPRFCAIARPLEWALVALALALVLWLRPAAHAHEAPDPRAVVAELLRELHYDGPPPALTWVDARAVVEACACRPPAFYRDNTAYLSSALDLTDVFDRSILLHELVHHVQWMAGGRAGSCEEWRRREELAHAVQNAWLAERGSPRRVIFTGACQ
jgi:hypothetical protein